MSFSIIIDTRIQPSHNVETIQLQCVYKIRVLALVALSVSLLSGLSLTANAHEYWLDPITPVVVMGGKGLVDIKNGENFIGAAYPYDTTRIESIYIASKHGIRSYTGRLGDYPAIQTSFASEGIHAIAVETNPQSLVYTSKEKFTGFLDYHGFDNALENHLVRNQPNLRITENYTRSAKSFLQVTPLGSQKVLSRSKTDITPHSAFEPAGHEFEMVLLDSPFDDSEKLQIRLLYQEKPLIDRQVELFWSGNRSNRQTTATNSDGVATLPLSGDGDYLLNAVHLIPPEPNNPKWASYWASVTFKRSTSKP